MTKNRNFPNCNVIGSRTLWGEIDIFFFIRLNEGAFCISLLGAAL